MSESHPTYLRQLRAHLVPLLTSIGVVLGWLVGDIEGMLLGAVMGFFIGKTIQSLIWAFTIE